jgi:apolipoprotein N-acyltransferase
MERLAGTIILLWGWRRAAVAFLAGALLVLAQAPYDFFAAGFVALPVLVWLLDGASSSASAGLIGRLRPFFATGWWFGFGYFLAGLWWIGGALLVEAQDFAWALPLAVLGVPAVLAIFHGLAAALARPLWSDGIGRILALAFAFGVIEWLRQFVLTGFPWNSIGYAAMPTPLLMQSVSIVGLNGMNALAVLVFAMPALLAARRHRRVGLALAAGLVALHAGFGLARLTEKHPDGKRLAVRVVQPSVAMTIKWDKASEDQVFARLLDLSTAPPATDKPKPSLVVWPETSVPFLLTDRPDALTAIGERLEDGQVLLAGAVRAEAGGRGDDRYYNAVVAIDAEGQIDAAIDKVHLVPFGEYLPFAGLLEQVGLRQLVAGPMNFEAGASRTPLPLPGGLFASAFICYEIIFPDMVAIDATSSDIIVNVTNDAWFGDTPGPYQHFRQAQVRAVETGRPVVRAANTGISGIIDDQGRIVDALALNVQGVVDAEISVGRGPLLAGLLPAYIGLGIVAMLGVGAAALRLGRRLRTR